MAEQALKNKDYDLISAIYHASQACETCDTYAEDAQRAGDEDAVRYFNEVRENNRQIIEKGKNLLKARL